MPRDKNDESDRSEKMSGGPEREETTMFLRKKHRFHPRYARQYRLSACSGGSLHAGASIAAPAASSSSSV
jgi:hypothetical protein